MMTVHPRVCGEQRQKWRQQKTNSGSSPRVRGTDFYIRHRPVCYRFIPACAGNSDRLLSSSAIASVHPRVCGEQQRAIPATTACVGSSPRVRGTVYRIHASADARRFIPACAGNRAQAGQAPQAQAVHPRVCGEQARGAIIINIKNGSSPRVRGTE